MQRGNEQLLAGAIYKPGSNSNRIPAIDDFKKIRELTNIREKLYKEIEKLNRKCDALAKEKSKQEKINFSQQVCQ